MLNQISPRYKLIRTLGSGGMGTVYLAEDRFRSNEQVALKLIHSHRLKHLDKFRREFSVLTKLRHPNLINVFDFGSTPPPDPQFYFSAEYFQGLPIDQWAAKRELRELLAVMVQITEVVHHLHLRSVLHLDLKPDNILVGGTTSPEARLIDLGLARFLQESRAELAGTVYYMAPEQIRRMALDGRTDCYALGVVLYQCLYQRLPFVGETVPEVIDRILKQAPTFPTADHVPDRVEGLVRRLLAKDPNKRVSDTQALLKALRELHADLDPQDPLPRPRARLFFNRELFFGRQRPFASLRHSLPSARSAEDPAEELPFAWKPDADQPITAIVTGPEGVGKSRLISELKAHAQLAHLDVFGGEHLAGHWGQLRAVVREIALLYSQHQGLSEKHGVLIDQLLSADTKRAAGDYEEDWLNREIAEFLLSAASLKPMVLWLDEADDADSETLTLLTFLVRYVKNQLARGRITAPPLLITITTARPEVFRKTLAEVEREQIGVESQAAHPVCRVHDLKPWTLGETGEYLRAALPELDVTETFVETMHRATDGIPRFLQELIAALCHDGHLKRGEAPAADILKNYPLSATVQELMRARLASLDKEALRLLAVIALSELPLPESLLRRVPAEPPLDVTERLPELLELGFVVSDSSGYRVATPILSTLITAITDAKTVKTIHRQLANGLIDVLSTSDDPTQQFDFSEAVAIHFHRAGETDRARPHALRAARALRDAHQIQRAVVLYRIANSTHSSVEIAIELAQLLHRRGESESALAVLEPFRDNPEATFHLGSFHQKLANYDRAIPCFSATLKTANAELELRTRIALAETYVYKGDYDAAVSECDAGQKLIETTDNHALTAALWHKRGLVYYYRGENDAARAALREALAILGDDPTAALTPSIFNGLGLLDHGSEQFESALAHYGKALAAARAAGQLQREITISMNIGTVYTELEDYDKALSALQESLTRAEDIGNLWETCKVTNNLALLFRLFGHSERARRYARVSMAIAEQKEITLMEAYNHSLMIDIAHDVADSALAAAHLTQLLAITRNSDDQYLHYDALLAQAKTALVADDFDGCVNHIEELRTEMADGDTKLLRLIGELLRARALLEMKRAEEARETLKVWLDEAQKMNRLQYLWPAHYLYGRACFANGDRAEGIQQFLKARTLLMQLQQQVPEEHRLHFLKPVFRAEAWAQLEKHSAPTQSFTSRDEEDTSFLNYREFKRFMDINQKLNSQHDGPKLLELIMDTVIDLTGAERGFLIVVENEKLRIPVARNIDQESIRRNQFKISRSIAEKVLASGEPLLSVDAQSDERLEDFSSVHQLRLRSILCFPLRVSNQVKGAIYIDNRFQYRAFSDRDLMILSAFGDQAGIAIHNAELIEANLHKQTQLEDAMAQVEALNRQLTETVEYKSQKLDEITTILSSHAQTMRGTFHNILSKNAKMHEMFRVVDRVAELDIPVFVYGESGTGKELVAKAIHFAGNRPVDKFISVNCGSIPENLLESELFGHVKGSFTGAYYDKKGLFTMANDGTLFLDEIGDMPLNMQVKLLRVLQDKRFRPVGGTKELTTNARIISASNKHLLQLVEEKRFRQDLFFRLNVVQIDLIPLRERREDIPMLVEHFMNKTGGSRDKRLAKEALKTLTLYAWPGNVRELENEVSRMVALSEEIIQIADLSPAISRASRGAKRVAAAVGDGDGDMKSTIDAMEKEMLVRALTESKGSITKTAKALGLSRMGVYKKMTKFELSREMFK